MSPDIRESPVDAAKGGSQHPPPLIPEKKFFNAVELRLFRYTAVFLCVVVLAALTVVSVWAFGWVVKVFYNLLLSLAIAGVLALVLHPVVEFLERRFHFSRLLATVLVLVIVIGGIAGLLFLLVPTLVSQIVQLMTILPESLARWEDHFSFYFPEVHSIISDRLEGSGEEMAKPALAQTGGTIVSYLGLLAAISFVPLFLFFTLLSGEMIRVQIAELLSVFHKHTRQKVLYFMELFVGYVTAFFQGQLIIAMAMGSLYAIGFTVVGLQFGVLLGLVLGLLNIVPFLGSLIGILVVLPMAYLQPEGGIELLALAALVFAAVQVAEAWLLTPKIMANRSGLHPALVVISLFFWGTALGGIIGMVLAVPLTAFFVAIWSEIKSSVKHTLSTRDDGL